jgi:hypothetical protein
VSDAQRSQLRSFGADLLQKLDLTQEQQKVAIEELKKVEKLISIKLAPVSATSYLKDLNKQKLDAKV